MDCDRTTVRSDATPTVYAAMAKPCARRKLASLLEKEKGMEVAAALGCLLIMGGEAHAENASVGSVTKATAVRRRVSGLG